MTHIIAENLFLDYPIHNHQTQSLKKKFLHMVAGGRISQESGSCFIVNALDDVSFKFEEGDRVALIGHNGAGKSTLLKVLAGIYKPTRGRLLSKGSLATLFSTTVGLGVDMTGYENLFQMSLFRTKNIQETRRRMDAIAEFTELGDYLNMPVRTYSEGMKMRLGFSVATDRAPDILLIDEVFGAGDKKFMDKSKQRMADFMHESKILVMSTHADQLIHEFCNKAILLKRGKLIAIDSVDAIYRYYYSDAYESL
jgi:ABC-type polysaccharide/polyol phosphate transport system ATPase subunit